MKQKREREREKERETEREKERRKERERGRERERERRRETKMCVRVHVCVHTPTALYFCFTRSLGLTLSNLPIPLFLCLSIVPFRFHFLLSRCFVCIAPLPPPPPVLPPSHARSAHAGIWRPRKTPFYKSLRVSSASSTEGVYQHSRGLSTGVYGTTWCWRPRKNPFEKSLSTDYDDLRIFLLVLCKECNDSRSLSKRVYDTAGSWRRNYSHTNKKRHSDEE